MSKTRKSKPNPKPRAKPKEQFWRKKMTVTEVPIWGTQVVVCVNMNEAEITESILHAINSNKPEFRNEAKEREILTHMARGIEGWDGGTQAGRAVPCGCVYMILLRANRNKFRHTVGILAHEIYHTVHYILGHKGMKPKSSSEEAYAYLVGFLTEEILTALYD